MHCVRKSKRILFLAVALKQPIRKLCDFAFQFLRSTLPSSIFGAQKYPDLKNIISNLTILRSLVGFPFGVNLINKIDN
jgi:hypothetical protein